MSKIAFKPTIPPELISHVISHVPGDDKSTLSACSQVSRWFRPEAQKKLFTAVHLKYTLGQETDGDKMYFIMDPSPDSAGMKLCSTIRERSDLAAFIREISFSINTPDGQPPVRLHSSQHEIASLHLILMRTQDIRKLSWLPGTNGCLDRVGFCDPDTMQNTLNGVLQRSRFLTHLDLSGPPAVSPTALIVHRNLSPLHELRLSALDISDLGQWLDNHPRVIYPLYTKRLILQSSAETSSLKGLVVLLTKHKNILSLSRVEHFSCLLPSFLSTHLSWVLLQLCPKTVTSLELSAPLDKGQLGCRLLISQSPRLFLLISLSAYSEIRAKFRLRKTHCYFLPDTNLQAFCRLNQLTFKIDVTTLAVQIQDGYDRRKRNEPVIGCPINISWAAKAIASLPTTYEDETPRLSLTIDIRIGKVPAKFLNDNPWTLLEDVLIPRQGYFKGINLNVYYRTKDSKLREEYRQVLENVKPFQSLTGFATVQYREATH
ncbi:hypothetical protein CVT24_011824 [Panaeolus cyanescens]|uniref:F-box domain-containing protein n=1 Tax=Panaeolus cyanescens TaxID=181874 RepID=A0A409VH65_9AGAR|nr:hypothetical protein CVT24_011824 [Panaeolus cyanescens]